MPHSYLVAIAAIVTCLFLNECSCQLAIQWPDPRDFKVTIEREDGKTADVRWPVKYNSPQNTLLRFSIYIRDANDTIINSLNEGREQIDVYLREYQTKYKFTGVMKSLFAPQGVEANVTVMTGRKLIFCLLLKSNIKNI